MHKLFYFNGRRFLHYLHYLLLLHLRRIALPFVYTSLIYGFAAFLNRSMDWQFFTFFVAAFLVNLFLVINLSLISVKIFSPLHSYSSLQEYAIPVSTEERFLGNFLFHGVTLLGLVYVINAFGYLVFRSLQIADEEYLSFLWGQYRQVNLLDYLYIYALFFAGGCYFRKSAIPKTLILMLVVTLAVFFTLGKYDFGEGSFLLGDSQTTSKVIEYLFLTIWIVGSYLKLRRSQFRV